VEGVLDQSRVAAAVGLVDGAMPMDPAGVSYRSRDVEHAELVRHPSLPVLVRRRRVARVGVSRHGVGRSSGSGVWRTSRTTAG
jgi:hypothetical protein